jgi:hypothetical protein
MPLTYGQQYAIYELLAAHSDHPSGKSDFRNSVERLIGTGLTDQQAVQQVANVYDPNLDTTAIGPLTLGDENSIRVALNMAYTGGSCPGGGGSLAIFKAIEGVQGPQ